MVIVKISLDERPIIVLSQSLTRLLVQLVATLVESVLQQSYLRQVFDVVQNVSEGTLRESLLLQRVSSYQRLACLHLLDVSQPKSYSSEEIEAH